MNPVQLSDTIKQLLQWDIDRTASLIAGIIIGVSATWWLMRKSSGKNPPPVPKSGDGPNRPPPNPGRTVYWQGQIYRLVDFAARGC